MACTWAVTVWIRAPKTAGDETVDLKRFPMQLEGWSAKDDSLDQAIERVLHTDQVLLRYYTDMNGRRVELFVAYYRDQKFGAQVHSPQHCLPGSGWTIVRHDEITLPLDGESLTKRLHIEKKGENQFVVYWFTSDEHVVQNEFDLKIRLLLNAFRHKATSVYFYRVSIPFSEHQETVAMQTLKEFLKAATIHINNS
jgi:EpsI family protein